MPGSADHEWTDKLTTNTKWREGCTSLIILSLIISKIKKKMEKGFLKTQKVFFQKVEYRGMFFKKNLTNK